MEHEMEKIQATAAAGEKSRLDSPCQAQCGDHIAYDYSAAAARRGGRQNLCMQLVFIKYESIWVQS